MTDEEQSQQPPEEYVEEALSRMRTELDCAIDHFDKREFAHIVMHMTNMAFGCHVVARAIVERLLSRDEIVQLMQTKMQEQFGTPVEFVGEVGGFYGFHLQDIEVPDDISGLEES